MSKRPFVKVSINGGTPITLSLNQFFPVCAKILFHEGVTKNELRRAINPAVDFLRPKDSFFAKPKEKLVDI